jgi:hypothetical protein
MDFLESIPVLTEDDFKDEEETKPTLEKIQMLDPSLTLDNPLTFYIFIAQRPDLPEAEKLYYLEVAKRLENNEALKYKHAIKKMHDAYFIDDRAEIKPDNDANQAK